MTAARKFSTSARMVSDSARSLSVTSTMRAAISPVCSAADDTSTMPAETERLPWADSLMLPTMDWVAAFCSYTAEAMVETTSSALTMVSCTVARAAAALRLVLWMPLT